MNKTKLYLQKSKNESWKIYQTLCNSMSMYDKDFKLECESIRQCLEATLAVLLRNDFILIAGSTGEGTHITSDDYGKHMHSVTPCYISDVDYMYVLCHVCVIDEGDMLPQKFDNHIYCQAERGEHTTDGFRKLRVIQRCPEYFPPWLNKATKLGAQFINHSCHHGYMSSSKLMSGAPIVKVYSPLKNHSITTGKNLNHFRLVSFIFFSYFVALKYMWH